MFILAIIGVIIFILCVIAAICAQNSKKAGKKWYYENF